MNAANNDDASRNPGGSATTSGSAGRTIRIVGDRIDSAELFVGTREIIISHGSDRYRLRLTAQNKLILTK